MNKGFKIKTKPWAIMENSNRYERMRMKYLFFRNLYLGFILLLAIITYITNKTIFLK